ncbi:MAG: transcriptional repressor LexA [Deltaproteobacteria bacterium]|nr:transcriptional repressor LexA [Deltaproteobacteria bacterium]NCP01796.1 transcriptional repressor LexA [Deltaproteobacteria bacterium]
MQQPTPRQQQVYDFIADYQQQKGYAPSLQEIAAHLKIHGNLGVMRHLQALEKKGLLHRTAGSSRGIVLCGQAQSLRLPVLGRVAAGNLSLAFEELEGYLCVDPSLVHGEKSFALRVKGDSMIEAQIAPGDLAIVRPQASADNGDIVVAMRNGEATLKRFFREKDHIRLQPANSRLMPILLYPADGEVQILGKVTAIVRTLA